MTIDEIIAVLQAYKEGKTIEFYDSSAGKWIECINPVWDFEHIKYRIKPENSIKLEPHYRPFESAKEVMEAIKEHGVWVKTSSGCRMGISQFNNTTIWFGVARYGRSFKVAFDGYYFEKDGTPFGKLVEE